MPDLISGVVVLYFFSNTITMRSIILTSSATILSVLATFFGVFNVLFSDVLTLHDEMTAFFYVLVIYAVLAAMFSLVAPAHARKWFLMLAIPAVVTVGLSWVSGLDRTLYHAAIVCATVAGSALVWVGAFFRRKKVQQTPPASTPLA